MTQKNIEKKVIAILADTTPIGIIDSAREIIESKKADILKLRLDCLEPQYLNETTIEKLKAAIPDYPLMISIKHVSSVPETRMEKEGFKSGKHDLDRIALLRKAAEIGVEYFELEHQLRRNFFLLGENRSKVVILYSNLKETPHLARLEQIYSDILRQGADYVVFDTLVKNKYNDLGEQDRTNLLALVEASKSFRDAKPLTVITRGKYHQNLNLDMYIKGLVQWVYGIVPAFHPIPFLTGKRTHQEMPTLDEINKAIKR